MEYFHAANMDYIVFDLLFTLLFSLFKKGKKEKSSLDVTDVMARIFFFFLKKTKMTDAKDGSRN